MNEDIEQELKNGFLEEAKELLSNSESCFLNLEKAKDDPSIIEHLFRLAHNLKGSSAAMGFNDLKEFTHTLESLLLKIKKKEFSINNEIINLLLRCNDHLQLSIEKLKDDHKAECKNWILLQELELTIKEGHTSIIQTDVVDKSSEPPDEIDFHQLNLKGHIQDENKKSMVARDESIRVNLSKIDQLLNNVGELVIMQSVLAQQKQQIPSPLLQKTVGQMTKIVKEVQEISMGLRMVPLKGIFQKMQRIARDTSQSLNKKIELILSGEETELDKTVIEKLGDPLVHLIRNAIDHGIESPEDRVQLGKSSVGHIYLQAYHKGGQIVIKVQDDGKGLDAEKLKHKAIEMNLISHDTTIDEKGIFQLIFASGFSTKSSLSDISGRGVGMDVVRTNINEIQGEIDIESRLGEGTSFSIFIPLTLAIIDAMVISHNNDRFVIPISQVNEAIRPEKEWIFYTKESEEILCLRNETLPVLRLEKLLKKKMGGLQTLTPPWTCLALIVREAGQKPFAILVDEILWQQQVVIKKLGSELQHLPGVSGAAILGDGKASLILDIFELNQDRLKELKKYQQYHTKQ